MKLIQIEEAENYVPEFKLKNPINLSISEGERIAILGNNGCGKSTLAKMLLREITFKPSSKNYSRYASYFYPNEWKKGDAFVKLISFENVYGGSIGVSFYQQRWNKGLDNENALKVSDFLKIKKHNKELNALYSHLGIDDLLSKEMMLLSSGELRKVQLVKSLYESPKVLIIENPFIGLDNKSRGEVLSFLSHLSHSIALILILSQRKDVPAFCNRIFYMQDMDLHIYDHVELLPSNTYSLDKNELDKKLTSMISFPPDDSTLTHDMINFKNVYLRYGKRTILKDLSWNVKSGDRWRLEGENGAGKSALLSLVYADNPQAYSCDITLFGHQRGHGESIWEIKKKIGFFSSEMYLTYKKNIPLVNIIASGLFDTIGLFRRVKEEDKECVMKWIELFHLDPLKDRSFIKLSSGEQRLALIARAFVKSPELLILDEPFQGLDQKSIELVKYVLDRYFEDKSKSLIFVSHYKENIPSCINKTLKLHRN